MNRQQRKVSELALIVAVPLMLLMAKKKDGKPEIPAGRLRNRLEALHLAALPLADNAGKFLTESERAEAHEVVKEFGQITGWEGKPKHIVTILSFCLELIEASEFQYPDKIVRLLVDVVDYYDRVKDARQPCFVGGALAVEKWMEVVLGRRVA